MIDNLTIDYDFVELSNVPPLTNVHCDYKIVEKKETLPLLKILGDIRKICEGYNAMSFVRQEDIANDGLIRKLINEQIDRKLNKLYRYYARKYGVRFEDDDWGDSNCEFDEQYRKEKTIEINLSKICERIKSWE